MLQAASLPIADGRDLPSPEVLCLEKRERVLEW